MNKTKFTKKLTIIECDKYSKIYRIKSKNTKFVLEFIIDSIILKNNPNLYEKYEISYIDITKWYNLFNYVVDIHISSKFEFSDYFDNLIKSLNY